MGSSINKNERRVDAKEKVTGRARYGDDIEYSSMLVARAKYSEEAHAEIQRIDTKAAREISGVKMILTSEDVIGSNVLFGDYRIFAKEKVRYEGDVVALVVAENNFAALQAVEKIEVEYKSLPAVFTIDEALAEDAPQLHDFAPDNIIKNSEHSLIKGDIEKGFAQAENVLERTYESEFEEHAYIEPESISAIPNSADNQITIKGSIQNPYSVRDNVAEALGWRQSQVRVNPSIVGGTFGGKDESAMLMGARASLAAVKIGRPVKITLDREESIKESAKRHPYRFSYRVGFKDNGEITAIESEVVCQGGAYNNKAQFTNWRAAIHTTGPYNIPHIKTEVYGVYTNTIYGGAMRGFSSPQNIFSIESLIDEIAEFLEMDPVTIREKNVLSYGDKLPTSQKLEPGGIPAPLPDMMADITEKTNFQQKRNEYSQQSGPIKKGIGLALAFRGAGLGAEALDATGAIVSVQSDGSITIISGLTDNGQGLRTAHSQIVAEELGVDIDRISYPVVDTSYISDGGPTVASRGTLIGGNAMQGAAKEVKAKIKRVAAEKLDCNKEELILRDSKIYSQEKPKTAITFDEVVEAAFNQGKMLYAFNWFHPGQPDLDHDTNQGEAYPTYSWGAVVAEVEVDTHTGKVDVINVTSAHDVGTAINPDAIRGQVYGGILMAQGLAIMEEVETIDGFAQNLNFGEYYIPTSQDMPEMDVIIYETEDDYGPFGAKSVGEPAHEIPAAAIVSAIRNATGKNLRKLPCSLERVLLGHKLDKGGE